ncbi:MAG: hypothetical protein ABR616_03535 [Dermatophilaceae bacterium]
MAAFPAPAVGINPQIEEAKRYGAERQINPFTALLEEVRRSAGHVAWLALKVQTAPSDDALLESHSGWLKLYQKEREHLTKVCNDAVRLGLEERVVRVEERKAEVLVRAMVATLDALGLPQEMRERVPGLLRQNLLAVEAASSER